MQNETSLFPGKQGKGRGGKRESINVITIFMDEEYAIRTNHDGHWSDIKAKATKSSPISRAKIYSTDSRIQTNYFHTCGADGQQKWSGIFRD